MTKVSRFCLAAAAFGLVSACGASIGGGWIGRPTTPDFGDASAAPSVAIHVQDIAVFRPEDRPGADDYWELPPDEWASARVSPSFDIAVTAADNGGVKEVGLQRVTVTPYCYPPPQPGDFVPGGMPQPDFMMDADRTTIAPDNARTGAFHLSQFDFPASYTRNESVCPAEAPNYTGALVEMEAVATDFAGSSTMIERRVFTQSGGVVGIGWPGRTYAGCNYDPRNPPDPSSRCYPD